MSDSHPVRPGQLILVPALITLAVTALRLVGELQGWSPLLFSREAGGGGALVGISWLVVVFGAWFGWRLARAGQGPGAIGRALGLTILAFALLPGLGFAATALGMSQQSLSTFAVYVIGSIVGLVLGLRAWPALGRTLLAYAFAARIPVALVMLAAILGNWGTHYDVPPPDFPAMAPLSKWLLIGLLPQMTIWIWFTVVVGSLFGILAGAVAKRRLPAAAAASGRA
jgi:hypothetical protein